MVKIKTATGPSTTLKPTVLIVATDRWYPTARLAIALAHAGCAVHAVCPAGHPLSKIRTVQRLHDYNGLMPLMSLERAIARTNPDLVIPADDLATRHLHQLNVRERHRRGAGSPICELIQRSLGAAQSYDILGARSASIQIAQEEGVHAPKTEVIADRVALRNWIAHTGFPTVLKANGTSGGNGVRVVNSLEEAEQAFRKLQAPPLLARAVKHALVDRDLTLIRPSLTRRRSTVNAQTFVAGREATSTLVCWEGAVLASLHFEVLEKAAATGHATVVRLIEHQEMAAAADKIVRRLQLSGFHGLDFMLEENTGAAHLIEINPRTTQVGHLTLGPGRDLPAALYAALTGKNVVPAPRVTESDTIALFPQEWKRDPASPFLFAGYHDVPWEEPALINSCVGGGQKQSLRISGRPARQQSAMSSSGNATPVIEIQSRDWASGQDRL